MNALEGLLRFALTKDQSGLGAFRELCAKAVGRREGAEDDIQDLLWKTVRSQDRAYLIVRNLAQKNEALLRFIEANENGEAMLAMDAGLADRGNAQLYRYLMRAAKNARVNASRSKKGTAIPLEIEVADPNAEEYDSSLATVRNIVRAAAHADEQRPKAFDISLEQLEALAVGDTVTEELVQACIAGDEELRVRAAQDPKGAFVTGRDRIQQRHSQARKWLLRKVAAMEDDRQLSQDDAALARMWIGCLTPQQARQRSAGRVSGGAS